MDNVIKNLVFFFYEMGTLRRIQRSYNINVFQETESVAEHSHRTAIIAYCLAKELEADAAKVILMAIFHDIPETRTGDSSWVQKQYINQFEDKALESQLFLLGKSGVDLKGLLEEYHERKSLESQIAKDADYIEYFLSLKELALTGNIEAQRRLDSENTDINCMYTEKGKEIAKAVKEMDPTDWTRSDLLETHSDYLI